MAKKVVKSYFYTWYFFLKTIVSDMAYGGYLIGSSLPWIFIITNVDLIYPLLLN